VIGGGPGGERVAQEAERHGKQAFGARLAPAPAAAEALRGRRVLAFAGIGRPEKFFESLRECGARVEQARAFPDHYPYKASDLAALRDQAARQGLQMVTTEKDLARIAGTGPAEARADLVALPVRLQLDDETAFRHFLLRHVEERRLSAMSL
jgi:tetraacyldisaccharide 4'-kinase